MALYTTRTKFRGYDALPIRSEGGRTVYQPVTYQAAPVSRSPGRLSAVSSPGSTVAGTGLFSSQPGTPVESGARFRPAKAQQAVRSTELLRFADSGPGVSALQDGSDALDGVVRALRAHLTAIVDGRLWRRADRGWAERLRDALASIPLNSAGHYSPGAVRTALLTMPSSVRDALDRSILSSSAPTARVLNGYTTSQLLADISGGRFSASSTPGTRGSGLLTASAAADIRNVAGRSAGGGATSRAQDLVDHVSTFAEGGSSGPMQDIMPVITPEQMDELRRRAAASEQSGGSDTTPAVEAEAAVSFLDSLPKPLVAAVAFGVSFGLARALRSR